VPLGINGSALYNGFMTPYTNVLPLRPYQQAPTWWARLGVVALYWLMAVYAPRQPWEALSVVFWLGLAYWILVHHRKHWLPFFVRFHLLQSLMLMAIMGIASGILFALLDLLASLLPILGLQSLMVKALPWMQTGISVLVLAVTFLVPFALGVATLLGKNLSLPTVSDQARQMA
jgi:uncharacterized membrane protein